MIICQHQDSKDSCSLNRVCGWDSRHCNICWSRSTTRGCFEVIQVDDDTLPTIVDSSDTFQQSCKQRHFSNRSWKQIHLSNTSWIQIHLSNKSWTTLLILQVAAEMVGGVYRPSWSFSLAWDGKCMTGGHLS